MPEQKIETGHSSRKLEKRKTRKESKFITSGIEEQSGAMARWSLSPTPIPSYGKTIPELAEALSFVEIVDPHIEKRIKEISKEDREMTEDDIAFAASVALAKAKVVENEGGLEPKAKEGLAEYKKTILSGIGKIIGKTGGEKALHTTAAISLALTACSTAVTPKNPEATQRVEAIATETVQIPTEIPTPTEAKHSVYGIEGGPAHSVEDPKTYQLRELVSEEDWEKIKGEISIKDLSDGKRLVTYQLPWGCQAQEDGFYSQEYINTSRELHPEVHDVEVAALCDTTSDSPTYGTVPIENYKKFSLDQLVEEALENESLSMELNEEKVRELSEQLECRGSTCMSETVRSPNYVDFQCISSGVFENIELRDENTKEAIGELTVLNGVSRDRDEKPIVVQIILQIELFSNPGVNAFPGIYQTLLMINGETLDNVRDENGIIDLEKWKEIMPESSMWTFILSKNGTTYVFLEHTHFKTQEYNQAVSKFINSSGTELPADLIIAPSGAAFIPSGAPAR